MKLSKIAATAAMTGALGSAALGIGAGFAQADPNGPNVPGPNVPGPDVPGPNQNPPGPYVPGQPVCNGGPGVNCNGPGSPLPPGHDRTPPPGHYNEPTSYGLPPTWDYDGQQLPLVFNPDVGQWGVNTSTGFQVYTGAQAGGAGVGGNAGGNTNVGVGAQPAT
jgi:hypothetical protein